MNTTVRLELGRWQDTLADVECDALIVDAPYSARTHGGHDGAPTVGRSTFGAANGGTHGNHRAQEATGYGTKRRWRKDRGAWETEYDAPRRAIDYAGWHPEDVREFVDHFAPRTRGWFVTISDHALARTWDECLAAHAHDRYVFAPLPWFAPGSRVRLAGDGPSSWTCWIVVARPRSGTHRDGTKWSKWGTLPGGYNITSDRGSPVVGAKPIDLMRALVRDYSRPGDVICDPCAGGGTTGRAAQLEGRGFIGAEMDPDTFAKAQERLAQPFTAPLLIDTEEAEQGALL